MECLGIHVRVGVEVICAIDLKAYKYQEEEEKRWRGKAIAPRDSIANFSSRRAFFGHGVGQRFGQVWRLVQRWWFRTKPSQLPFADLGIECKCEAGTTGSITIMGWEVSCWNQVFISGFQVLRYAEFCYPSLRSRLIHQWYLTLRDFVFVRMFLSFCHWKIAGSQRTQEVENRNSTHAFCPIMIVMIVIIIPQHCGAMER